MATSHTAKPDHEHAPTPPANGPSAIPPNPSFELSEPVGHREILTHPSLPYRYEVVKVNELYHVVERLGRYEQAYTWKQKLQQRIKYYKRILPLLVRFMKEAIIPLGKRRLSFYLLTKVIYRIVPFLKSESRLYTSELIYKALEAGRLSNENKRQFLQYLIKDMIYWNINKFLPNIIEKNKEFLNYRFKKNISRRLLDARVGLDAVTAHSTTANLRFDTIEAAFLNSFRGGFFLEPFIDLSSQIASLISLALAVKRLSSANQRTTKFAYISFIFTFFDSLRWNIGKNRQFLAGLTNPHYKRMKDMEEHLRQADAQEQVLSLQNYFLNEYKDASERIGEVLSEESPNIYALDYGREIREKLWAFVHHFSDPALDLLFVTSGLKKPFNEPIRQVMRSYATAKLSTSAFSSGLFDVIRSFRQIKSFLGPLEEYYQLDLLQPLLAKRAAPIPFDTTRLAVTSSSLEQGGEKYLDHQKIRVSSSHPNASSQEKKPISTSALAKVPSGATIEFRNVSFKYPGSTAKALDDVSFTIRAGQMASIVGFSGSGKSTLVSLLIRIHDPDEGCIIVNGHDVREYDPVDYYKHIAMLFQTTSKTTTTVREFIGMGNLEKIRDEEAIITAAKMSGAWPIIQKLKYGLETELVAPDYWDPCFPQKQLMLKAYSKDRYVENSLKQYDKDEKSATTKEGDAVCIAEDLEVDARTDLDTLKELPLLDYTSASSRLLLGRTLYAANVPLPAPDACEASALGSNVSAEGPGDDPPGDDDEADESAAFSKGEWTKVVLARHFLREDADLSIVDEASASLDPHSEAEVFRQLLRRRGDQTIISVTHRYHLAARSDVILFLREGKIVEQGSHRTLMAERGEYWKMYNAPQEGFSGLEMATQTDPVGDQWLPV